MKRRLFSLLTALLLMASTALPLALASETEETTVETTEETTGETTKTYSTATSGSCGKDVTWQLEDHTLIITGSGEIDEGSPWEFYKDTIHNLVLRGEITVIGAEAFAACNNLRYIDFGSSLKEIGYRAFYSCNALEAIRLPESFRKFEQECFMDCDSLQIVYCEGPMPSFRGNCLYTNHTVQVLYSHETPWPYEEVSRLMSNFGARLHVDLGSPEALEEYLEDAPVITAAEAEPVPVETEPETQPTVPETTVPETTAPIPVTEPVTEPTVPETTAPAQVPVIAEEPVFVLESEPLFVTEPEHIPQAAEETRQSEGFSGWVWVIIIAAALTGILILVLVVRMVIHSTGRYED